MNKLAGSSSPYLLQHADNPVHWRPWSSEALELARRENKPILLSVGYSACHWCHVMAHESFENTETAALMNENFVNIKVDREERPDLDLIYQNVAQILTGGGGWPLTVFLTPDLKPYFGGTYFPPEDRYGRPGFKRLLVALSDAYRLQRPMVEENALKITEVIEQMENPTKGAKTGPDVGHLELTDFSEPADKILTAVDWVHGGVGSAPKFPNPMSFSFLLRLALTSAGSPKMLEAVRLTATRMASGGIFDHLAGGFSRYSVDARWAVPHFEKMLYDNGLLLKLYAELILNGSVNAKERTLYVRTLSKTVEWLDAEMRSSDGGFYAALDADSEGVEGKFYAWMPAELFSLLGDAEGRAAASAFGVSPEGNFEHGSTVLFLPEAERTDFSRVDAWGAKLLQARSSRVRPGTDSKRLVAWNALAASGLAWASRALQKDAPAVSARAWELSQEALAFCLSRYQDGEPRVYSDGTSFMDSLDDAAFTLQAVLDCGMPWTSQCTALLVNTIGRFNDPKGPGFFFTPEGREDLLVRPKSLSDQAIPSGSAVLIQVCLALEALDPDPALRPIVRAVIDRKLPELHMLVRDNPFGYSESATACLLAALGPVTLKGPGASQAITHPFVFAQEAEKQWLVCHRGTCFPPETTIERASALAARCLT